MDGIEEADGVFPRRSIPYCFEPVRLTDAPGVESLIIDGGTLSNFPVWRFDVDPAQSGSAPCRPTFGSP
jgi:predicted acylesterase/phospholipase RssA